MGNHKNNEPADLKTFFHSPLFTTTKTRSNTTTNNTNENDENDDFSRCFPFKPSPNNASKPETKKRKSLLKEEDVITTIKKKKRKFEEITSGEDESHKDTIVFPFVANTSSSLKKQKKKTKSDVSGEQERVEDDVARPSDPPPNGVVFAKGGNAKEQMIEKMVFDASKTTFTDFDKRKKTTTTTKRYKNFSKGNNNKIGSKKKPPPFAAASSFNVAAAVAKKKAQIEVSAKKAQEVGFGSSARKPVAYSGIASSNSASKKGVGSSVSAAKKERGKRSSGFSGSSFEVHQKQQQHQPNEQQPNEFQKMIQKARENLRESSKKGLHSPQPAAAAVHHRPVFVAAQNSGKHQRFASPPSIPKSKTNITTTPKFPINQTFVSAAQAMNQNNNNSKQEEHHHHPNNNNNNIVDIVARAKQKTYLPSTAEKAKKKAKETYEKKRIDAERKEKLGQLRELDETLSSKTNIIIAPKDDEKSEKNKRNMYNNTNNNNRVFGGAMTKAQKAHMAATEWEPL